MNPNNLSLTAGGSSGGEGALVSFRGSILGVGTDIAGSIRIPSLCCGVYGFKPTSNRIPYGGQTSPSLRGLPGIIAAAGPLAHSVKELKLFVKAVLGGKPWTLDSTADAVPWMSPDENNDDGNPSLLRIGILHEDPLYPLQPPVRRALSDAVSALSQAGHTLIQLPDTPATSVGAAWDQSLKFFSLDPTSTSLQNIFDSGEPMINTVAAYANVGATEPKPSFSLTDLAALNRQRVEFQDSWRRLWIENKLDAIIAPGAQHTAVKHDTYGMPCYTVIWNLLDVSLSLIIINEIICF